MRTDWLSPNLPPILTALVKELEDALAPLGLRFERFAHPNDDAGYYREEDMEGILCVLGVGDEQSFYCIVVGKLGSLSCIVGNEEAHADAGWHIDAFIAQLKEIM
jgi:hypothetical protein